MHVSKRTAKQQDIYKHVTQLNLIEVRNVSKSNKKQIKYTVYGGTMEQ